ncbi:hypothetical protein DV735_g3351, partial [Chaetothyriales sp. CBS 134920]
MHFALPPKKTWQPPLYARTGVRLPANSRRRQQLQLGGYAVLALLTLYLLWSCIAPSRSWTPDGEIELNPKIVIVTMFDDRGTSREYRNMIRKNREHYAGLHGYSLFHTNVSTYLDVLETEPSHPSPPTSWAMVPALRHALKLHPDATYLWYLSDQAFITEPSYSLSEHIFSNLSALMQKDVPVVPPDSVIHTFSHLKPAHANLILTQDMDNLANTNLILRNTKRTSSNTDNWAHFFLDAWFDPLYRQYSFQKAENHALEHLVQWHPTILAKLVLIPQRQLNSYNFRYKPVVENDVPREHDAMWRDGDFVINLKGCDDDEKNMANGIFDRNNGRVCEAELRQFYQRWERKLLANKEK